MESASLAGIFSLINLICEIKQSERKQAGADRQ
jgi:hypothetical protein